MGKAEVTDADREMLASIYGSRIKRGLWRLAARWYLFRRDKDNYIRCTGEVMLHSIFEKPRKG